MAKERRSSSAQSEKPRFKPQGRRKGTSIRSSEHELLVNYLIAVRTAAGLTQAEMARRVEKDPSHINRIEKAERDVSVLDLVLWCKAVGMKFTDFAYQFEQALEVQQNEDEGPSS